MENETIKFISKLELEMKSQGQTPTSLSAKIGVADTTVARTFQLKNKPNLDIIIKIMKELNIKEISI